MKFVHQFDRNGAHRLIVNNALGTQVISTGPWVSYSHFATVQFCGQTYYAATNFWDGTFPVEAVFKIKTYPTTTVEEVE